MRATVCLLLIFSAGCRARDARQGAMAVYDIGVVHRTVTTTSSDAQRWFDRGLGLTFNFNHAEAVLCFDKAAAADPQCAMAYWGKAYALGPNYNSPAPSPEAIEQALGALDQARAALDNETPAERALVHALRARYARPASDRPPLEKAFAVAMRKVHTKFPDDPEICAWTAEALMQVRPWGLWSHDGKAAPETPEIRRVLETGLARWPKHPALCHLYIHAMEAGPEVARALPAARTLESLTPGLGHLIHMPSHIYVWTGHYEDVIRVNLKAVAVDDAFARHRGMNNFYTAYRVHNYHFVAYGAMWDGQRALALKYARAIPEQIPAELLRAVPDLFDVFHATPYHVMVRFGMWDEMLREPRPAAELSATLPVWHYARGIAFASLGRVAEAETELALFRQAKAAVPETRVLFNNPVSRILEVADKFLAGEIEYRKKSYDRAFGLLRDAVVLDEKLNYDEPWGWMEPTRHALGALLTEQGHHDEAIAVYRANLKRYPNNGWALHGLAECFEKTGQPKQAAAMRKRFQEAWRRADVTIPGSCFCKRG